MPTSEGKLGIPFFFLGGNASAPLSMREGPWEVVSTQHSQTGTDGIPKKPRKIPPTTGR